MRDLQGFLDQWLLQSGAEGTVVRSRSAQKLSRFARQASPGVFVVTMLPDPWGGFAV